MIGTKLATLAATVVLVTGCAAGTMTQYTHYFSPTAESGTAVRRQRSEIHPFGSTIDGPPDRLELTFPTFDLCVMVANDKETPLTGGADLRIPIIL
jgi:hypothetical protein